MNICPPCCLGVTLLLLGMGAVAMAAPALTMEVKASRELQLAVVDVRKPDATHDAMHRRFALGLGAAVSGRGVDPVEVKVKTVKPAEAKSSLKTGGCDAVLVLGDDRPFALRRLDELTLCGELEPEAGLQPIYLIVGNGDVALRKLLIEAFSSLLADRRFLRSLTAKQPAVTDAGDSLAIIAR